MALTGNHRILQGITGLIKSPLMILNNKSTITRLCNFPVISVAPKRYYIPSLTLSRFEQTTDRTLQVPDQAQHGRREEAETKETKYVVSKKGRWTAEEQNLLTKYVKDGTELRDTVVAFPNRTVGSIDMRMSTIRRQLAMNLPPTQQKARKSPHSYAWTAEEDQLLRELMDRIQQGSSEALSWRAFSDELVKEKRLARTTTSCKRRWDIIRPNNHRKHGYWDEDEVRLLIEAVLEQAESGTDTSAISLYDLKKRILELKSEDLHKVNWQMVASRVKSRSDSQCRGHLNTTLRHGHKGSWSNEEMAQLNRGLKECGQNWNKLGKIVQSRSPTQIKMRVYHLTKKK